MNQPAAIVSETVQKACSKCSQGVMDADCPGWRGNDHLSPGRCPCACHAPAADTIAPVPPSQNQIDIALLCAQTAADALAGLLGGSASVTILIYEATPALYHALPHPLTVYRSNEGRRSTWREIARGRSINSRITVTCGDGQACPDQIEPEAADIDADVPIPFTITEQGRAALVDEDLVS